MRHRLRHAGTIAVVYAHRAGLVVDPLADPGLDQDATGRCLDQQAVERLEESVLMSSSSVTSSPHSNRGTGPNNAPGVRAERAGLDERDRGPATESARQSTASLTATAAQPLPSKSRRSKSVERRGRRLLWPW